ncbi:hypothetical protein HK16_10870 [Acetobacter senegalensis]|uniref:Uncharacterized protein n=2 Tax=Acetobacter TaxID=434 RepID=A0A252EIF0_9PROT|nr:hypothetical protein CIW82_10910 [Acetobacter tropicalis]OUL66248.1 hypothetical protein HK16_10870 [Acetobacter senegalensis]
MPRFLTESKKRRWEIMLKAITILIEKAFFPRGKFYPIDIKTLLLIRKLNETRNPDAILQTYPDSAGFPAVIFRDSSRSTSLHAC